MDGHPDRSTRPSARRPHAAALILPAAILVVTAVPIAPSFADPPTTQPSGRQPAQNPREPRPPAGAPRASLQRLLVQLEAEARQALDTGALPRAKADIAATFPDEIPSALIAARLVKPADRDPLVDAYVRWQLTSFDPDLPDLNARAFTRLLEQLPAMVPNPQADRELMRGLRAVADAGPLSEANLQRVAARLDGLAARTSRARALNEAALGLRRWLDRRLPETGPRRAHLALESCSAMIESGWNVEWLKARIEETFAPLARDLDTSDADRQALARAAHRLAERSRPYISSARLVEDALALEYDVAGVYDFEARRWVRALQRR